MVIFELRSRAGKKVGALVALILGGLSFATMFSGLTPFSEGQTVCVALSAVLSGLVTICAHLKTNHSFNVVLCEVFFYTTLLVLIGLSISLYT